MTEAIALRVACPDLDTARQIARAAVAARLAACGNISDVQSVYRWQDNLEEDREAVILFKTTRNHVQALCDLICRNHPYDLPAISWHGIDTTSETAVWLETETAQGSN